MGGSGLANPTNEMHLLRYKTEPSLVASFHGIPRFILVFQQQVFDQFKGHVSDRSTKAQVLKVMSDEVTTKLGDCLPINTLCKTDRDYQQYPVNCST